MEKLSIELLFSVCCILTSMDVTKNPAVARVDQPYHRYTQLSTSISQSDYSPTHSIVTLLYRTLQSTLRYDTIIYCT